SGIGTSKRLATKIHLHFTEIASIEKQSLFDLDRISLSEYDLIVSTIPIKHIQQDYILASPILTETDIHQIKRKIRQIRLNKKDTNRLESNSVSTKVDAHRRLTLMQRYANEAVPIINGFYLMPVEQERNLEDLLSTICEQLEERQVLNNKDKVVSKLLKRMKIG